MLDIEVEVEVEVEIEQGIWERNSEEGILVPLPKASIAVRARSACVRYRTQQNPDFLGTSRQQTGITWYCKDTINYR